MKFIILIPLLISTLVNAQDDVIQTDKIKLNLTFGEKTISQNEWIMLGRYGSAYPRGHTNSITLDIDIKNITSILIIDMNLPYSHSKCPQSEQSWKTSQLLYLKFKNIRYTGILDTRIHEPCIIGDWKSNGKIKLKVSVSSDGKTYYRIFDFKK